MAIKDLIVSHAVKMQQEAEAYHASQAALDRHRTQETYQASRSRLDDRLKVLLPEEVYAQLQYYMVPSNRWYKDTRAGAMFYVDNVTVCIQEMLSTRPHDELKLSINGNSGTVYGSVLWDVICKQSYLILVPAT